MSAPSPAHRAQGEQAHDDCVHLLWTGGWDSTFRLLQLLLVHRVPVVPWYLEDPTRASTGVERRTMARIAGHLHETHPHTRALLRPLRVRAVAEIPRDAAIDQALREIRKRSWIGDQYAWLPAFCRHEGLKGMELGVHVDDKVQALLRDYVTEFDHPCGFRTLRVDDRHADTPEHRLFHWFTFPLFGIDKVGIARQSAAAGWDGIMDMTWFCHTPVHGRACGLCPPCVYTIEEGLAYRVPRARRVLSFFWRHLVLPFKPALRRMRARRRRARAQGNPTG